LRGPTGRSVWQRAVLIAIVLVALVLLFFTAFPQPGPGASQAPASSPGSSRIAGFEYGTIMVRSTPEAMLYINGESFGRTPRDILVAPGSYEIKLVVAPYQEWTHRVHVRAGEELVIPPLSLTLD
jgi:hypothetical protein